MPPSAVGNDTCWDGDAPPHATTATRMAVSRTVARGTAQTRNAARGAVAWQKLMEDGKRWWRSSASSSRPYVRPHEASTWQLRVQIRASLPEMRTAPRDDQGADSPHNAGICTSALPPVCSEHLPAGCLPQRDGGHKARVSVVQMPT